MKDLNLTVVNSDGKEIVFRTGEADKIAYAKPINITGILAAPYHFFEGKKLDCQKCHIQIKKDTGVIALHILDTDPHSGSVIIGQLKKDGYFDQWGINTEKRWTVSQFLKHVKMQKTFFSERSECDAIVESLQKWGAKVETVIKQHNDNSGNSLSQLERTVSGIEVKTKFKLRIPIFQGYPKQEFVVEIGFDPKATAVDLYLYSEDLFAIEIEHREQLIESELSKFKEFPCSKVVLS
jgi:hypothetical protein